MVLFIEAQFSISPNKPEFGNLHSESAKLAAGVSAVALLLAPVEPRQPQRSSVGRGSVSNTTSGFGKGVGQMGALGRSGAG